MEWNIALPTREAAETVGKALAALGWSASMTGVLEPKAVWFVRTDAPLGELRALGLVR